MKRLRRSLLLSLLAQAAMLSAQLDTIHWLPPMHARDEWGPQFLYLSTPEEKAFPVSIRDGAGNLITTVEISNSQPYRHSFGNSNTTPLMVAQSMLHQAIKGKGLVIDGPEKFYAYFRVHSNSSHHAGDLTCKGRAALGKKFRIGHLIQAADNMERRSNFVGVMATEDSTIVSLSGFDPKTGFQSGSSSATVNGDVTVVLHRGESAVFSQYLSASASSQPPNGLIGALLVASKPVAVNCGSWVGAPVVFTAHDIGIDQIAPLEKVGKEYILCKGNGSSVLETPIVVAHYNGTQVWLNGNATPAATLDAGEYFKVPTSAYSSADNLYIRASESVFLYQVIGGTAVGDDAMRTAGLIFVPPISCGIPNEVDNIFQPNLIGTMRFEGGLMLVAMKDSAVTVRIDGQVVPIGTPASVPGNEEFVTYRNLTLFSPAKTPNTISVTAKGAVQVAMFGRNQPASFAAFYSGFSKILEPELALSLVGDGVCPDTLYANGRFDGVQWFYEDSLLQFGPDTFLVALAPGRYVANGYLGVCRRTDFAADTVDATFVSPAFSHDLGEPSCYGYADGEIVFGTPYGGFPPYSFSIDDGQSFHQQNTFGGLEAGFYKLVARDSKGCYNRPLDLNMSQPDSFTVDLTVRLMAKDLKPGGLVRLEAVPERPVAAVEWEPAYTTGCPDCLEYAFRPEESTMVTVTVYDAAGCPAEDRLWVEVEANVFAPNVIRPASAEGNDRFTLFSRHQIPIRRLAIFDRWGGEVFLKVGFFTNNPADGWDGSFRGKTALPGVYAFFAEVEVLPGKVAIVKGDVTVLR
jgi:hypothetical protein